MTTSLRIAVIGSRGVPALYGGVERHVEEIGARLVDKGHDVTVFTRTNYTTDNLTEHRGMHLRPLRTIGTKHLDALVHSASSTVAAARDSFDVVHYHSTGPSAFAVVPRYLSSAKVVVTIHSRDVRRAKWGPIARSLFRGADWISRTVPDAVVAVSRGLASEYAELGCDVTCIPNGATVMARRDADEIRRRFGLEPGSYVLFVGRFDPDKSADLLVRAFARVGTDRRLVLVGGSSFTDDYLRRLTELASDDPRVVFAGYAYGALLEELYSNAGLFVLPSRHEGLPLTLLEAAAYALPIVASDIAPHREVLVSSGPGRMLFPVGDEVGLADALDQSLRSLDEYRDAAVGVRDDVLRRYSWDDAADATEAVYLSVAARSSLSR